MSSKKILSSKNQAGIQVAYFKKKSRKENTTKREVINLKRKSEQKDEGITLVFCPRACSEP